MTLPGQTAYRPSGKGCVRPFCMIPPVLLQQKLSGLGGPQPSNLTITVYNGKLSLRKENQACLR